MFKPELQVKHVMFERKLLVETDVMLELFRTCGKRLEPVWPRCAVFDERAVRIATHEARLVDDKVLVPVATG